MSELTEDPLLRDVPEVDGYKILAPCVLLTRLGQGGMGTVYRGRHVNLDIEVAVKCLKRSLAAENEQFVARFQREARLAASINSPHLIRVFDVSENHGLHYLVMELVRGETARERVVRKGPLEPIEAATIILGAARGLAAAHEKGIVHRDIKPDNILISVDGEVKVADLGLAKAMESSEGMTATNVLLGTPQYMAPEQWEGNRELGPPCDVWALGATLYFLLAGKEAIAPGPMTDVLRRVCMEDVPDVRTHRPEIPQDLAAAVARSLARAEADRYPEAMAMARDLERIVGQRDTKAALRDAQTGSDSLRCTVVSPPPERTIATIQATLRSPRPGSPSSAGVEPTQVATPRPAVSPNPAASARAEPISSPASAASVRPGAARGHGARRAAAALISLAVVIAAVVVAWRLGKEASNQAQPGPQSSESAGEDPETAASQDSETQVADRPERNVEPASPRDPVVGMWSIDREATIRQMIADAAGEAGESLEPEMISDLREGFRELLSGISIVLTMSIDGSFQVRGLYEGEAASARGRWRRAGGRVVFETYYERGERLSEPDVTEVILADDRLDFASEEPRLIFKRR